MGIKKSEDKKSAQVARLDFNFALKTFKGKEQKTLKEEVLEKFKKNNKMFKSESELYSDDNMRIIKASEQLSSFIGSASKSFNDRAWSWRVSLHTDGYLELDQENVKVLEGFVKELLTEGKMTNDDFYINYSPVFEAASDIFK